MSWTISLGLLCGLLSVDEPDAPCLGTRAKLTVGQLFVPEGYSPREGRVHLIVHLHGAASVCEPNLVRSGQEAVLVSVALNGLSGVYTEKFSKPEVFQKLLDETLQRLRDDKLVENPTLERVTVSSFSAGFGGVRELLKSEPLYQRIDSLVMADSIYAGYLAGSDPPTVDPRLMEGFLRFARDAADGKKTMIVSHCQLQPDGYASTKETADYLIGELGLSREGNEKEWAKNWTRVSHCQKKGLQVHGFTGETGQDHMQHLRQIALLWKRLP